MGRIRTNIKVAEEIAGLYLIVERGIPILLKTLPKI